MTLPHTPPSARATWSRSVLPPAVASALVLAACAGAAASAWSCAGVRP
ncbi:hypothetical protein [Nocardiopsis protaetiae]